MVMEQKELKNMSHEEIYNVTKRAFEENDWDFLDRYKENKILYNDVINHLHKYTCLAKTYNLEYGWDMLHEYVCENLKNNPKDFVFKNELEDLVYNVKSFSSSNMHFFDVMPKRYITKELAKKVVEISWQEFFLIPKNKIYDELVVLTIKKSFGSKRKPDFTNLNQFFSYLNDAIIWKLLCDYKNKILYEIWDFIIEDEKYINLIGKICGKYQWMIDKVIYKDFVKSDNFIIGLIETAGKSEALGLVEEVINESYEKIQVNFIKLLIKHFDYSKVIPILEEYMKDDLKNVVVEINKYALEIGVPRTLIDSIMQVYMLQEYWTIEEIVQLSTNTNENKEDKMRRLRDYYEKPSKRAIEIMNRKAYS